MYIFKMKMRVTCCPAGFIKLEEAQRMSRGYGEGNTDQAGSCVAMQLLRNSACERESLQT